jgi:carboxylesterase
MELQISQNMHQPFLWEAKGSDTAVLLVHGILGSPNQFESIAQTLLEAGCSVRAILLPGHGGSAKDFAEARTEDWRQAVHEAAVSLRQRYRHVFLLGHSMGGLLIIGEAIQHGADGLILISVPMRIKIGLRSLRISMKVLWGDPNRDDERIGTYRRAFSVQAGSLWQHLRWTATYREFIRLMKNTRRGLGKIHQPVLVIQSKKDETVSWKSTDVFNRELSSASAVDVLMLEQSGHSYHYPDEASVLADKIRSFIKDPKIE